MTAADSDDLWSRVDTAIFEATSRAETIAHLNRLLRKCVIEAPCTFISEVGSTLVRERLTVPQLEMFWRGHHRTKARRYHPPIVVADFRGTKYVLDGTTRINDWVQCSDEDVHETIIIRHKGSEK
jgi:hypothetical protein